MAPAQAPFKSVWTQSNMKARSKSHIAIKLYKLEEAHPTIKKKIVLINAALLRFVIIVPIIGKT